MAKTDIEYGPERLPSLRGSFYLRRQNGNIVMCAWPKRQKRRKSTKRQAAMDMFADAAQAVKKMDQSQIQRAMDLTPGTQALWRDVLYLSIYGRLPVILTIGEQEYRPLAGRKDATEILDALGLVEGGILYRGEFYWEILPPGENGQVLTFDPATNKPYWADPVSGAGVSKWIEFSCGAPPAIQGSAGISSITRTAAGRYRIEFTAPFGNNNYQVAAIGRFSDSTTTDLVPNIGIDRRTGFGKTTNSIDITITTNADTATDAAVIVDLALFAV